MKLPLRVLALCASIALFCCVFSGCSGTFSSPPVTVNPSPILTVSSASVDFSATPLNVGNRATQTITLTNSSPSGLSLTFKIGGASAEDFKLVLPPADAQTSTRTSAQALGSAQPSSSELAASTAAEVASTPCGISGTALLASGQNCALSISFQPQAAGTRTASLAIGTSESSRPQLIPLTGTAVPGSLTLSPNPLVFPATSPGMESAPLSVTVTNTGIGPVGFHGVGTTGNFKALALGDCPTSLPPLAKCSINVTFTPISVGSFAGTFFVVDNFDETYYIDLSGTGVQPPPSITVTPTSLTFPDTAIGLLQSESKFVTVTNAGLGVVTGITVDESDPDTFHVSSHDCRAAALKPGESCQIPVEFVPSTVGAHNATITVSVTGSLTLPRIVNFSGAGVRQIRELTFTPSTLDFPNSLVHAPFAKSITVTSTGNFPITIGFPSIAGGPNSEGFTADDTSCRSFRLLPGQTCQVQVEFFPNTLGPHAATLTLDSDATGIPRTVTLTGDAVPPKKALTLSPSPLDFGETPFGVPGTAPRLLTITNTGNVPVALLGTPQVSGANAGDFQVTEGFGGLPCVPGALGAGQSCTSQVRFIPQALGDRTATITIASDADVPAQPISLLGKGVPATRILSISPPKLDFPNTSPGSHNLQFLGIANTGNSPVNISRITLDTAGDFTITDESSCPLSLGMIQPGTSCIVALVFSPAAVGSRTSSVSIFSDAGSGLQTVPLSGNGVAEATRTLAVTPASNFDDTNIGRESFENAIQLTNMGTADITGVAVSETGDTRDFFQRGISSCTGTLTVGASCFMEYAFSPRAAGPRKAILTVTGDQASNSPQSVLTGNGVVGEPKTITVLPAQLDFHSSVAGVASAPQTVTITSVGTDVVSIQGISLTPPAQKEFAIIANNCPTLLSPNTSCKVLITFTPGSPFVVREAALAVESDAPVLNTSVYALLEGTGPVRTISIEPLSLTFPPTTVGSSSAPQTTTIKNTGLDTITFGTVEVTGDGGDFSYSPACPSTLNPGQSCSITVQFVPLGPGPKRALVRPGFQDLTGPQQLLAVSGTGLAAVPVLQSITVAPPNPTLAVSATQQFTATGHFSDGTTQDLTNTATWASGTSANVTINSTGLATAVHAGTSTISATSGGVSGSTVLTVSALQSIGGTISGLTQSGLVLANGADIVSPAANATTFTFPTRLDTGAPYSVTVRTQPSGLRCLVSAGSGTVGFTDVTTVEVVCSPSVAQWVWENGSATTPASASYGTPRVPSATNVPGPRDFAVSWMDSSDNLWMFGGNASDSLGHIGGINDLWKFDPTTGQWTWMSGSNLGFSSIVVAGVYGTMGTPSPSNLPGARTGSASWIDAAGNFWLFGGGGPDDTRVVREESDLWKFDPSSLEWTWMKGPSTGGAHGTYGTRGTADSGNAPGARISPLSWTDSDGNLWLFGGDGFSESGNGLLNDLWRYRPATNDWTWMGGSKLGSSNTPVAGIYGTLGTPSPMNAPGQREFATTWTDPAGNFWMFGGLGTDSAGNIGFLNDLWKYNPRTGAWTWVSGSPTINAAGAGIKGVPANSNVPESRQLAIGWRDQDGNLWLFGGDSSREGRLSDLWQYNLASGQWTWVSGSSGLDDRGVYGMLGLPAATNAPGARSGGVSWTDHAGNLWHFGGIGVDSNGNVNLLNDLWKYLR